ncbi:unnamed protein product [Meloidogyne enterolobii]|uniref:Uncharacterized protein n=1 Tax=Meloidogyne enterolobii TaxID=390850 RepID=A0ACB0ZRJ3_MELEN
MTKVPEIETVENRKWLKSRNSEIFTKFLKSQRKKRRKSEVGNQNSYRPLLDMFGIFLRLSSSLVGRYPNRLFLAFLQVDQP